MRRCGASSGSATSQRGELSIFVDRRTTRTTKRSTAEAANGREACGAVVLGRNDFGKGMARRDHPASTAESAEGAEACERRQERMKSEARSDRGDHPASAAKPDWRLHHLS